MMKRLLDDEDLVQIVINEFLADIPRQIQILKDALAAEDTALSTRQAHSIKGAAANVGGDALCAVASAMEKEGKVGDLSMVGARLTDLEDEFARLKAAIEEN